MEIFKEFSIEAAHLLPNVPEGHKCRRLHGHSFHIAIHVRGALEPKSGWVMDFADVGEKFQPLFETQRPRSRCNRGRQLTNAYGHTVGFKNTVIVMTSDLGLQMIFEKAPARVTA